MQLDAANVKPFSRELRVSGTEEKRRKEETRMHFRERKREREIEGKKVRINEEEKDRESKEDRKKVPTLNIASLPSSFLLPLSALS